MRDFLRQCEHVAPKQPSCRFLLLLTHPLAKKRQPRELFCLVASDSHAVERTVYKEERDREEGQGEPVSESSTLVVGKLHGEFYGEQPEKRSELDNRVESDRRCVLERIADGVSNNGCIVQRSALLLHLHFNNFLGIVPGCAGVGHKDCLIKSKNRERDQVANEEEWVDEGECQRAEEHRDEDVQHPLLRVFGADGYHFLAFGTRGFLYAFEF